ncbi:signal recognition particle protein [uncultured Propionibacterium sp.]|uniref:signal recognition particle protein n=1 Tax=uncultured Propionibacterium sp. TaxID=218066 RepID=UPI0037DD5A0A
MFDTLQDRLAATFKSLRGRGRLTDADIDATTREIRIALLEADVALPVVREFVSHVRDRAKNAELSKALNPTQQIVKIVNEELISILGGRERPIRFAKSPDPTVIMLAGLQGAGKTTLAGKLGRWLSEQGRSPVLVAADLQRPNAVQQLQVVGERAGVRVYAPQPGNGVGDPVQVARDSIDEARHGLYDVVIVDTAGRLGVDEEMMAQARDIKAAVGPDETLFVVDAMIGQDAVNTARAFEEGVGIDGVVLSKLDGDARGGAALSIARVLGKPIMFASNGERLADFDLFHPDRMASRILGMGDMLTLIEQAEKAFDEEQARADAEKLLAGNGEFGLQDFLSQLKQLRTMGPLTKIFGMLPGMGGQMKAALDNLDEREVDRLEAIILSMTPAERADVGILNGSRRARIARGAGVSVHDVNSLVSRFIDARKMMQSMGPMMGMNGGSRKPRPPKAERSALAMDRSAKKKGKKTGNKRKGAGRQVPTQLAGGVQNPLAAAGPQPPGTAAGGFELPDSLRGMFDE